MRQGVDLVFDEALTILMEDNHYGKDAQERNAEVPSDFVED